MTITILNLATYPDAITGAPGGRTAEIIIDGTGNTYRLTVGSIPLAGDAQIYLDGMAAALLADAQADGRLLTAQETWQAQFTPLQRYFGSIILSLYNDVDNAGVTLDTMLANAAAIVATNATQSAKFNAYRTRMGLGGTISSMTAVQKQQLLVLGLEWAAGFS